MSKRVKVNRAMEKGKKETIDSKIVKSLETGNKWKTINEVSKIIKVSDLEKQLKNLEQNKEVVIGTSRVNQTKIIASSKRYKNETSNSTKIIDFIVGKVIR